MKGSGLDDFRRHAATYWQAVVQREAGTASTASDALTGVVAAWREEGCEQVCLRSLLGDQDARVRYAAAVSLDADDEGAKATLRDLATGKDLVAYNARVRLKWEPDKTRRDAAARRAAAVHVIAGAMLVAVTIAMVPSGQRAWSSAVAIVAAALVAVAVRVKLDDVQTPAPWPPRRWTGAIIGVVIAVGAVLLSPTYPIALVVVAAGVCGIFLGLTWRVEGVIRTGK